MRFVIGTQLGREALRENRKEQVALEQGEVVADADARAGGERVVSVVVAGCVSFVCPAVGIEYLWALPELRMPVRVIRRQHDAGARGHVESADLVGANRVAHVKWGRRV